MLSYVPGDGRLPAGAIRQRVEAAVLLDRLVVVRTLGLLVEQPKRPRACVPVHVTRPAKRYRSVVVASQGYACTLAVVRVATSPTWMALALMARLSP